MMLTYCLSGPSVGKLVNMCSCLPPNEIIVVKDSVFVFVGLNSKEETS